MKTVLRETRKGAALARKALQVSFHPSAKCGEHRPGLVQTLAHPAGRERCVGFIRQRVANPAVLPDKPGVQRSGSSRGNLKSALESIMLKTGSIILSIHACFNCLLASAILVAITVLHQHAPILYLLFDQAEVPRLDSRVLATANALAILFNTSAAAISFLSLWVVWCALRKGQRWLWCSSR
jgi:hypothetical protein